MSHIQDLPMEGRLRAEKGQGFFVTPWSAIFTSLFSLVSAKPRGNLSYQSVKSLFLVVIYFN